MSDSSIMSVREMIDTCFGEPEVNIVNFKLMQTILYLLARQQRLLERRVAIEFDVSLIPRRSSLSITEVKLKAKVDRKKKIGSIKSGTISSKSKGDKLKSEKISKYATDETSTYKSTTADKTSKQTTDETSKSTTDRTSRSTTDRTSRSTTDKTSSSKSTSDQTKKSKYERDAIEARETMKPYSTSDQTHEISAKRNKTKHLKSKKGESTASDQSLSDIETTERKSKSKKYKDTSRSPPESSLEKSGISKSTQRSSSDNITHRSTTEKSTKGQKSLKSPTDKGLPSELSSFSKPSTKVSTKEKKLLLDKDKSVTELAISADEARARKTRKTYSSQDYHHLLELIEQQREQELRVVHQRADSREVAEKTPTPMASLDSMEVQYEKLLVVERVPVEEAEKKIGRLRGDKVGKLDVVTQAEFDELVRIVKEMQIKFGITEDGQLLQDYRRSSSVTDSMAALQISSRIENLEKSLKLMEMIMAKMASKKPVKVPITKETTILAYPVQQAMISSNVPETKVIYNAPHGPSNISTKSERETDNLLSEPQFAETEDQVIGMLDTLPRTNINEAELDDAMQKLYNELIKYAANLTNVAISKADEAMKCALAQEAKLNDAIDVEARMDELEKLVSEYAAKINVLDASLSSQMSNYQELLTQMQHDLEAGLEGMAEALANPPGETPGVAELNANFGNLQIQFDIAELRQNDLQEKQVVLTLDVQALWKEIERLREIKADRDEVADALRDKAGLGELNGLVTQQQFDAVRGDFEKRIGASYNKFNNQEIVWQKIIDDLFRELNEKADLVQVMALRDDIDKNIEMIHNKISAMEEIVGEPRAATISRRLFRDAACLSCSSPAHMNLEESILPALPGFFKQSSRPPTIGAEDTTKPKEDGDHGLCYRGKPIPHAIDPRSHFCRRYCGGSHTTGRGTLSRGPSPTEVTVNPLRRESTGDDSDGKTIAEEEKEKKPCGPCNIPKAKTQHGLEIGQGTFELDSETAQYFVLPAIITTEKHAVDSAISDTPPPPIHDD